MKFITLLILNFFDYFHKKKIVNFLKYKKIISLNALFDVGAHRGESVKFFTNFIMIKKIYCFEPSPDNFRILKKNVNRYLNKKHTKVTFENIALGKQNSEKKLIQFKILKIQIIYQKIKKNKINSIQYVKNTNNISKNSEK